MPTVLEWGTGARVVFVHGAINGGEVCWTNQRRLAEHRKLIIGNRLGYFPDEPIDHEVAEDDIIEIGRLLEDGAHLVGHSGGAVLSLFAAARWPERIHSLAVSEPPVFQLVADHPAVMERSAIMNELRTDPPKDALEYLRRFTVLVGSPPEDVPTELTEALQQNVTLMMRSAGNAGAGPRPDLLAAIKVLAAAPFSKLVTSGGHNEPYELACDALAVQIGADREIVTGKGHRIPHTGEKYNAVLEAFWDKAESTSSVS